MDWRQIGIAQAALQSINWRFLSIATLGRRMKLRTTLLCASLGLACLSAAHADTLAKVRQNGSITLAYRESSVPFISMRASASV